MNRMRALIIKSSRKLARPIAGATHWWRTTRTTPVVALDAVSRRLELLLTAMYGSRFEITALAPAKDSNIIGSRKVAPIARSSGVAIELPATMDASDGQQAAIARYRLLAVEQAARIVRSSNAHAPVDDMVARDLYSLREGAAIDASIARESPGLASVLVTERARALSARKSSGKLSAREQSVERLVLSVLRSSPSSVPSELGAGSSSEDSLAWARDMAASIQGLSGEYRARPPIGVWGATLAKDADESHSPAASQGALIPPSPGYGSGKSAVPFGGRDNDQQELSPQGTNASTTADDSDNDKTQDNAQPLDDAAIVERGPQAMDSRSASPVAGVGRMNETDAAIATMARSDSGILYPEWDCNASQYRPLGAVVHAKPAVIGDRAWADRVLGEHPALVRRVRREFERLKARRVRMLRQREGDELDLDACVRAFADTAAGDPSDDRLYMAVRAARRAVAITVLVDVSGSTGDELSDGSRVIDVEKTTLLLASEAFDALGDSYSIQTFASNGAADVRVSMLKSFGESNSETVRRRIAGIEAGGNTRLGAAIRHATAVLSAQPAGHRLLLILSDGKPNDVDRYFTTYAIEDSRQAIFEARAAGVYPFCLTVDASDPQPYLARVFGAAGHTILRRPEQLPVALLDLVRTLLRGRGGAAGGAT